jgi:hypothetical protein
VGTKIDFSALLVLDLIDAKIKQEEEKLIKAKEDRKIRINEF